MSNAPRSVEREYTASVETTFVASHAVRMPDGEMEPMHEHEWRVEARFASPALDGHDMVIDFCVVSARLESIVSKWTRCSLNDAPAFAGTTPTAERVAACIFNELADAATSPARLTRVSVTEAPGCAASFGESE